RPNDRIALRDLAGLEAKIHHYPAAEAHYRQALRLASANADLLVLLGNFLLDHSPSPDREREAHALLRKSLDQVPDNPHALLGLGRIALNRGDARQGALRLERAGLRSPSLAQAWYHLGRAFDRLGETKRAADCRAIFKTLTDYSTELYDTEVQARNRLNDPHLRLK